MVEVDAWLGTVRTRYDVVANGNDGVHPLTYEICCNFQHIGHIDDSLVEKDFECVAN